ncbi:uncharacterized protein DSM5745_10403 [Aspergillus mulundensis]|uniref:Uncharacterized protein n=1 Tax=Aspergillus mulundensis TaxID=1810919 RepID=A0A3D8QJ38_9EURO|nr:Uncharacterized protein DSM5745_10403 [Aspergillus mulundensis]RDW61731.1 Uncharacterized protein DSM5745_10403 [Aspergillus mulundensis]
MTIPLTRTYHLPPPWTIKVGTQITPPPTPSPASLLTKPEWTLKAGIYTPRQIVHGFAPLLNTVLHHLKPDPAAPDPRSQLLNNMSAILATETRESSLPFPRPNGTSTSLDRSRAEIRHQAERIGRDLVSWASEDAERKDKDGDFSKAPGAVDLALRSRCEGHLLTPENVDLVFGPRSRPALMQLFNEYMHQMVLLRDALLPFVNYGDVLIPITHSVGKVRGLRFMEGAREKFLAGLFTKQIGQAAVVEMARALLVPGLTLASTAGAVGYGFQYGCGVVIPAVFSGGREPLHLLQYIPAQLDASRGNILFEYEFADYYSAPRVEISPGTVHRSPTAFPETGAPRVESASLVLRDSSTESDPVPVRQVDLSLSFSNGQRTYIDLGQIARGKRYSYKAEEATTGREFGSEIVSHAAHEILLTEAGLVTSAQGGFHVIAAEEKIVALAVLGRIYPENVVMLSKEEGLERAVDAGKGFEPKFVVWS